MVELVRDRTLCWALGWWLALEFNYWPRILYALFLNSCIVEAELWLELELEYGRAFVLLNSYITEFLYIIEFVHDLDPNSYVVENFLYASNSLLYMAGSLHDWILAYALNSNFEFKLVYSRELYMPWICTCDWTLAYGWTCESTCWYDRGLIFDSATLNLIFPWIFMLNCACELCKRRLICLAYIFDLPLNWTENVV